MRRPRRVKCLPGSAASGGHRRFSPGPEAALAPSPFAQGRPLDVMPELEPLIPPLLEATAVIAENAEEEIQIQDPREPVNPRRHRRRKPAGSTSQRLTGTWKVSNKL